MKLVKVTYMDITEDSIDEKDNLFFTPAIVTEVGWLIGECNLCLYIKKELNSVPLTSRVCCIPLGVIIDVSVLED